MQMEFAGMQRFKDTCALKRDLQIVSRLFYDYTCELRTNKNKQETMFLLRLC